MTSEDKMSTGRWIFLGFAIPILAELLGAFLIVTTESGAYAEGFSYIVVLVILIVAIPVTLFGNAFLVPRHIAEKESYLPKSMILPALFFGVVLIYYTGIWDKVIHPLFPRDVAKIQTASGHRVGENTWEAFYTVFEYTGSSENINVIQDYAVKAFDRRSRECADCIKMNVYYYFVPHELYDPIDYSVSRENAIAVFRHMSTDVRATIEQVER